MSLSVLLSVGCVCVGTFFKFYNYNNSLRHLLCLLLVSVCKTSLVMKISDSK